MALLQMSELRKANLARGKLFHGPEGVNAWPFRRWVMAAMGELGEAMNAMKKVWREDGTGSTEQLVTELCDVVMYLDLAVAHRGWSWPRMTTLDSIVTYNDVAEVASDPERALVKSMGLLHRAWYNTGHASASDELMDDLREVLFLVVALIRVHSPTAEGPLISTFNEVSYRRGYAVRLGAVLGHDYGKAIVPA